MIEDATLIWKLSKVLEFETKVPICQLVLKDRPSPHFFCFMPWTWWLNDAMTGHCETILARPFWRDHFGKTELA